MGANQNLRQLKLLENEVSRWADKYWARSDYIELPDIDTEEALYHFCDGELLSDPETIFEEYRYYRKLTERDFQKIVLAYLSRLAIRKYPKQHAKFEGSYIDFLDYSEELNG